MLLRGFPPTHSEIAKLLNVKRQTAKQLLEILERKGYVLRDVGVGRSIRLTDKPLPFPTQKSA
jgi:Mn-dependent DtxR family transcriptional regulator